MKREEFITAIESGQAVGPTDLKSLSECGDILPHHVCDILAIPSGSTYAQAAAMLHVAFNAAPAKGNK